MVLGHNWTYLYLTQFAFFLPVPSVTGSCTDAKATKVPHWITVIYTDYWICCDNSHARAQCIREGPKKGHSFEPTSRPSALESDVPSSQPSELHSHVPSGQPSAPTASPTTLYWGALRVSIERADNIPPGNCAHITVFRLTLHCLLKKIRLFQQSLPNDQQ